MEITSEQYESLEAYIEGSMSEESEAAFEVQLKNNPALYEYYCFEMDMREGLAGMEFKKNFSEIEIQEIALGNETASLKEILLNDNKHTPVKELPVESEGKPASRQKVVSLKRWI